VRSPWHHEPRKFLTEQQAAKRAGDFAKADDFYSGSLFFIKLLKAAGEDVEAIR